MLCNRNNARPSTTGGKNGNDSSSTCRLSNVQLYTRSEHLLFDFLQAQDLLTLSPSSFYCRELISNSLEVQGCSFLEYMVQKGATSPSINKHNRIVLQVCGMQDNGEMKFQLHHAQDISEVSSRVLDMLLQECPHREVLDTCFVQASSVGNVKDDDNFELLQLLLTVEKKKLFVSFSQGYLLTASREESRNCFIVPLRETFPKLFRCF